MTRELKSKHTAPAQPSLGFTRPEFTGLKQRRFLACVSATEHAANHVWVDDDGSCKIVGMHPRDAATGKVDWSKWHLYQQRVFQGDPPRSVAVRCPSTLESDEWKRVRSDDPPGAMKEILRQMLSDATSSKRARRASQRETTTAAWEDES